MERTNAQFIWFRFPLSVKALIATFAGVYLNIIKNLIKTFSLELEAKCLIPLLETYLCGLVMAVCWTIKWGCSHSYIVKVPDFMVVNGSRERVNRCRYIHTDVKMIQNTWDVQCHSGTRDSVLKKYQGEPLRSQHRASYCTSHSPNLQSCDVLWKGCFCVIIHVAFFSYMTVSALCSGCVSWRVCSVLCESRAASPLTVMAEHCRVEKPLQPAYICTFLFSKRKKKTHNERHFH